MDNFADVMQSISDHDASLTVTDADSLAGSVDELLDNSPRQGDMAARAARVVAGGSETLQKTLAKVEELLKGRVR